MLAEVGTPFFVADYAYQDGIPMALILHFLCLFDFFLSSLFFHRCWQGDSSSLHKPIENKKLKGINMNRELVFLRCFAATTAIGLFILASMSFKSSSNKFDEIDVQRINIVEPDGTVKMIITSADKFPAGSQKVNGRLTNETRKKRSGMLFYNEDGIECGGFIYDGAKMGNGHSSGLSLTYDQYDGDQVMQLLTQDYGDGMQRKVRSTLVFNDRPDKESQLKTMAIIKEYEALLKSNPSEAERKLKEYEAQGLIGGTPRIMLGKSRSDKNGLFLYDDKGNVKAMFYIDKENRAKLDFFDEKGNVVASFPPQPSK